MSWIDSFLDSSSNAEAPDNYFYWSALAVLSGTVSNRVFLNKGGLFKLYPNLFVFLISKSSGLGKGVPVDCAKKVLVGAGTTRLIVGQNSIEGIISELSKTYTTKSGRIISTAEATLLTGEFGSFLLQNPKLFTDLTDLYDTQYNEGEWKKRLASRDTETLNNICITGLFAANEVHFKEALPIHAIKGGFFGRTICVYESKRRKLDSLIGDGKSKVRVDITGLIKYLKELSKVAGEFSISEEASSLYNDWYYDFYRLDKDLKDDTGTAERLRDNILKVAMLSSLSDSFSLLIEKKHMEEGLIRCFQIYSATMKLVIGEGKSNTAIQTKSVLRIILGQEGQKITRRNLLIRGLQTGDYDYIELDRVLEHLFQVRILSMENKGKDIWYLINMENVNALLEREKRKEEEIKEH